MTTENRTRILRACAVVMVLMTTIMGSVMYSEDVLSSLSQPFTEAVSGIDQAFREGIARMEYACVSSYLCEFN